MRDRDSLPVFKNQGTAFDPPGVSSAAHAKRVIRCYRCSHTNVTKTVTKQVYQTHDKQTNAFTVRTSVIDRTPPRPISSGFHTKEEKREEAMERAAHWQSLSVAERVALLDVRLGPGKGAVRQRAKLALESEQKRHLLHPSGGMKTGGKGGGVNQPHTSEEKVDKQATHAVAVAKSRVSKK